MAVTSLLFKVILVLVLCLVRWSYVTGCTNQLLHTISGNKQTGYKLVSWNCGRRLLGGTEQDSDKFLDIKMFIQSYSPHLLAIIESDLHGPNTTATNRRTVFSTQEIRDKLNIEGYNIEFPSSWVAHDQARLIVFVSDKIKAKRRELPATDSDLPSLTFEIGLGREKKTLVNFYYREFTGIVSDRSKNAQSDRLNRQVNHWRSLAAEDRDLVLMGDANFDAMKWEENDFGDKDLANIVLDFNLEESVRQLVSGSTRTELRAGRLEGSCIDHISTNCPLKCSKPVVVEDELGSSDHLAVSIQKYSKELNNKPKTIRKRSYKYFNKEDFIREIQYTDFSSVTNEYDINKAAELFSYL